MHISDNSTTAPSTYLAHSAYIDWQHPALLEKAQALASADTSPAAIAKACFEFVRDDIQHSMDFKRDGTTCKASDVLQQGHGYCYAKSHLLAALLRANHIPTALCYQRLTLADFPEDNETHTYCLHGLNAIYLPDMMDGTGFSQHLGWYRVDPRGNKGSGATAVNAQFSPPTEQLAFAIKTTGEHDFPALYAEPLPEVIHLLSTYPTYQTVLDNLPDVVSHQTR